MKTEEKTREGPIGFRQPGPLSSTLLILTLFVSLAFPNSASALTDAELRAMAPPALELSDVPNLSDFDKYVRNQDWLLVLGKALFWEERAGGDGIQACASCHFQAGADNRSINQLAPGLIDITPGVDETAFDTTRTGGGGPNYQLVPGDFPFLEDSQVGNGPFFNDVVSSQGVYLRDFIGFTPDGDNCNSVNDATFHIGSPSLNTRRVEPRNTPTIINAIFNHRNFWDGRANHEFNLVNPAGARAFIGSAADGSDGNSIFFASSFFAPLVPVQEVRQDGSVASQSVGPPGSAFEMSCGNTRSFPDIGNKLLFLRALENQTVHPNDSVFGSGGPLGSQVDASGNGLKSRYSALVKAAFKPQYWMSPRRVTINGTSRSQIEANFSLFWGVAIQKYIATQVSEQTPFDAFARGNDSALTAQQKQGLEVFLDEEGGRCIACHTGPEFSAATLRQAKVEPVERMIMGNGEVAVYDNGFYNIGVTPTLQDLGVGGTGPDAADVEHPLSFARQLSDNDVVDGGINVGMNIPSDDEGVDGGPIEFGERVAVDGAFKVPGLRNVELTAPFFHNGSHATLLQVVEFYDDILFEDQNIDNLDPEVAEIEFGGDDNEEAVAAFMRALTDPRVAAHSAPFDHPSLRVPNGHVVPIIADPAFPAEAQTEFITVPAVGAGGYGALPAVLDNFLGLP